MNSTFKNEPQERSEVNGKPVLDSCSESSKKVVTLVKNSTSFKPLHAARIFDEDSMKGRFGWAQIMTNDMPYIFRTDSKYICLRMLEQKILSKLFFHFYKELVSCGNVKFLQVNKVEAGLLNEINSIHCNFQFGKERFSTEDLLLKLHDAGQLCGFLHSCYFKLENVNNFDISQRFGFIRINKDSVVPYSVVNKHKCVPLFYFEGETDELKQFTIKMENWDLAYLKFCCKIQGIRNDLVNVSWCQVVSVNNLKSFFPPDTIFEEYWPARREPTKDLKQKVDTHTTLTLNSIYDMAVNTFTPQETPSKQIFLFSPSKLALRQKKLSILPKFINIKNDPMAPSNPSSNKQVTVTHEYLSNSYTIYKLQQVIIENKMVVCINMKPNDINDKWVAVMDLSTDFFYRIPVQICEQVLDVLGIDIYKANTAQMRILRTTGRYNTNEVLSMVQVDKVIQYLPQLTYMIRNILCKSQTSRSKLY